MIENCFKTVWKPSQIFLLTLFLIAVTTSAIFSQVEETLPPTIEWDKTIAGSYHDYLQSVISTTDGGYLLAGYSQSNASGDKSENIKGGCDEIGNCYPDYWIVKVDDQGKKQWDKTFGGSRSEWLFNVISTTDGGYLLAGTSDSDASEDKSENSKGGRDYWIVKVDAEGNKIWDKTFGGNGRDEPRNVISTGDGGYLLAGFSDSDASGDKSEDSKGGFDYWIVKIDAEGNKIWDKTFGGNGDDILSDVVFTEGEECLLAGGSESTISGDKSEDWGGRSDYWIVKIDTLGNKQWDKSFGRSYSDDITSTSSTPDGGYLLLGKISNFDASGDESEDNKGRNWVIKIDGRGNKVWDKTFGFRSGESLSDVVSLGSKGYLLAGDFYSYEKSEGEFYHDNDYLIIKIDTLGNKIWDKTFGGNQMDRLSDAIVTLDEGYLLAGFSDSDMSDDKSENNKGRESTQDYWIIKIKEQNPPSVTSFTLISAKTDQEVRELNDEDTVYLAETGTGWLNVRANTSDGPVDRVELELQGPVTHMQTEQEAPYALFGDHPTGDFKGRTWIPGTYTLTAIPYIEDKKGTELTISFEVTDAFAITGFTLIDATQDQAVGELSEGKIIDLASYSHHPLTIRAETKPMRVGKVTYSLEGPIMHSSTEWVDPYSLFGDTPAPDGSPNYVGTIWKPGTYTLTATPYALDSMGVASTITFTVIDSESAAPEARSLQAAVYPVPTSGVINISYEGGGEDAHMLLLDFGGNKLLHQPLRPQPVEQLDLRSFKKGIYYLKIISTEAVQVFRVVVE